MGDAVTLASAHDRRATERDDDLALAARTDPDAFGRLYDRHRLAVYRYLRTRTATDEDAAELTAVTFERALGAIARYRPAGGGFVAWLIRIARNAAIDARRRSPAGTLAEDVPDERPGSLPELHVLAAERRAALRAAIDALPPSQREAIALRYAARLTAREIGAVLGRSDQATQKLLSRALGTIREACRDE